MGKTVGVCIIAKNEEALLARCLASVVGADQLVICDTGSTDRTIEIAKQFGAEVFLDFVWCDDYSAAQNHAKAKMKTDFVLSIDCDEFLDVPFENVRQAVELCKDVVRVQMIAEGGDIVKNDFGFGRLFRNTPDIYWCQSIHKHLNVPGEGEPVGDVRIVYGRSPAHDNDPDRSLRMLEHAVATETDPCRNLYYLGREYWYKQRYQDAVDTFQRYIKVAHWLAELADAYFVMAQAYCELRLIEESAAAVLQAIKINPNFKEAVEFMSLISIDENKAQWNRMARTASNEGVLWKRTDAERVNDLIAIFPHNDDESLFFAFSLLRIRPLVVIVTESHIQPERGDIGCGADVRRQETIEAMKIAGCPVVFLGIKDSELTEDILRERLKYFNPEKVYVPGIEGGNRHHDMVANVAIELFGLRCVHYTTYSKTELHLKGTTEIKPTAHELELKEKMLACYKSQLALPSTLPHFNAVRGQSEWLY